MVQNISDKIGKVWKKLLKAWTLGKEKKAVKLQHKMLKLQLKKNVQNNENK
jgi:hypothetical protein